VSASPHALAHAIRHEAAALGFSLVGITTPDASEHVPFYREWLAAGRHGEMRYLAEDESVGRRADLTATMRPVRSVVVTAHEYFQNDPPGVPGDPSIGVIARYARGRDYHAVVKQKVLELARRVQSAHGDDVRARAYVDTGPILERELANRAGLGWFGKNTMLIHPRKGSYFFLGVLLLDVALPPDTPFGADHCGTCRACLDACPTGALLGRNEEGAPVMDARHCISYLTIELEGPIPRELRPAVGNRVFGCDICQEACPFNGKFAEPAQEPGYAARGPGERPVGVQAEGPGFGPPRKQDPLEGRAEPWHPGTKAPALVDLLRMTPTEWESFSRGSAIRRAGYAGLRRNVAVALGNWGSAEAAQALLVALDDPEPLVRGHAAWALGRIGSPEAAQGLRNRMAVERDAFVSGEIEGALAASTPHAPR
jgi:epoxyqueuosine reductase